MLELSISKPDWQTAIRAIAVDVQEKAALILEAIGVETIAYLRSLTSEMRPPARAGEPARFAHPGGWADDTGQLALSYGHAVERLPEGARLTLTNGAEYAVYLEQRHGYFVLTGVTEPGGPIEAALIEVVPRIAPGMRVVVD